MEAVTLTLTREEWDNVRVAVRNAANECGTVGATRDAAANGQRTPPGPSAAAKNCTHWPTSATMRRTTNSTKGGHHGD